MKHEAVYQNLVRSLEEILKLYSHFLGVVKTETQLLIECDLKKIQENNQLKEASLMKIQELELHREAAALEMAVALGQNSSHPRLLDFASALGGPEGEKLKQLHTTLTLTVQQVTDVNYDNMILARSAMETLNGTINAMKSVLQGKPTYEKHGQMEKKQNQQHHLMSKEA